MVAPVTVGANTEGHFECVALLAVLSTANASGQTISPKAKSLAKSSAFCNRFFIVNATEISGGTVNKIQAK
jgi:hypothetical protein